MEPEVFKESVVRPFPKSGRAFYCFGFRACSLTQVFDRASMNL